MAVLKSGGRDAVTDYVVQQIYGIPAKASAAPMAARVACTLHTGRTHQIRVHMASKGPQYWATLSMARAVRRLLYAQRLLKSALAVRPCTPLSSALCIR